jgi:tetratricopeptide (TPR) repeat protein
MAKRKDAKSAEDQDIVIQEVQGSSQPFYEQYQQYILYGVGAIGLIFLMWWAYKVVILEPKQKEAEEAMWQAQVQFERDSFQLALENPGGGYDGLLTIIENYGGTPAGNVARYYAGVSYLQLGNFDKAIEQLESFDAEGNLLPIMKYGLLGDCYSEKGDFEKAISMYEKAADEGNNHLLAARYLKKAGMLSEKQGNKEAAKKAYERVKKEFPDQNSPDWRDIDKYIERVSAG